jgi:hypothetical protein
VHDAGLVAVTIESESYRQVVGGEKSYVGAAMPRGAFATSISMMPLVPL